MAALAALGAVSGLAFPPGRGTVLFFAQMKSASWPGIAVAAGAFFAIAMAALSESARLGGQRPGVSVPFPGSGRSRIPAFPRICRLRCCPSPAARRARR